MSEKENVFRKYIAELIGTFVLVFVGTSAAVMENIYAIKHTSPFGAGWLGIVGVALAFGLSLMAMVFAIGHISGCHLNPAVSIALCIAKKIKTRDLVPYIVFQSIGAIIASAVLFVILSGMPGYDISTYGLGANGVEDQSLGRFTASSGFIGEVVLTFLLVFVIFGATDKLAPSGFAGIPIGLTLVFIHIIGIPITGVSVNPARSLGPAVFVGGAAITSLWIFIVAPIIGGLIATGIYMAVKKE